MVNVGFCNGKIKKVKIHESLIDVCDDLRKQIAEDFKKRYHLTEIIVPRTLSSQILASEKLGRKIKFNVKKTSLNKGELEIQWL